MTAEFRKRRQEALARFYPSQLMASVQELRLTSFVQLALRLNRDPKELEEYLFGHLVRSAEGALAYYDQEEKEASHRGFLRAANKRNNYWCYIRAQEEYLRAETIDLFFGEQICRMGVNTAYLEKIGAQLPTPVPQIRDQEDLEIILLQIPLVLGHGLDFNAFIARVEPGHDIPYLALNLALLHVLDIFTVKVAQLITAPVDTDAAPRVFRFKSDEDIQAAAEDAFTASVLISCVEVLQGRDVHAVKVEPDPIAESFMYHATVPPALNFISMHEYAHLLLGHIEEDRNKSTELQADLFGILYLQQLFKNRSKAEKGLAMTGLAAFFMLMQVNERLTQNQSIYYPTTEERLIHLLRHFSLEEQETFLYVYNKIYLATHHTLEVYYNVSLWPHGIRPAVEDEQSDIQD